MTFWINCWTCLCWWKGTYCEKSMQHTYNRFNTFSCKHVKFLLTSQKYTFLVNIFSLECFCNLTQFFRQNFFSGKPSIPWFVKRQLPRSRQSKSHYHRESWHLQNSIFFIIENSNYNLLVMYTALSNTTYMSRKSSAASFTLFASFSIE